MKCVYDTCIPSPSQYSLFSLFLDICFELPITQTSVLRFLHLVRVIGSRLFEAIKAGTYSLKRFLKKKKHAIVVQRNKKINKNALQTMNLAA